MIDVDGNVYDVDIALPTMEQGFLTGEGRIGGVFDYPEGSFKARDFYCQSWLREDGDTEYCVEGLSNVGVLLFNATKQRLLGFALTDYLGRFHFDALPFGTYQVMADLPRYGRGMCEEITLSPNQPVVEDLHLYVNSDGKVRVKYDPEVATAQLSLYPNPAETEILVGGLKTDMDYQVAVMDVLGMIVMLEKRVRTNLLGEFSLSVAELPAGVYFVQIKGVTECVLAKFVKR